MKYINNAKPTKILTSAKKGVTRGLPRKEAMTDQSRAKDPMPIPRIPDPIFWAVTDLGNAQHTKEMADNVGKR